MYRISARQILVIALISALFSAAAVALVQRFSDRFQPSSAAFTEAAPPVITNVAAPDELNNIEVYKKLSPGVVNVHSTSYARDFFGYVEPREGSGSGSVIDQEGHILTNHHVIEGAQKVAVSFGGQKNYAATVIGRDPDTDLAVIQAGGETKRAFDSGTAWAIPTNLKWAKKFWLLEILSDSIERSPPA